MPTETPTLYTASTLAKHLGVSDAKVKKAIKDLEITPTAKKGCCAYYAEEAMAKLKTFLK